MLKDILVGLSGSEASQLAAELALQWAQHQQASVTALAVMDVAKLTAPQPIPLGGESFKAERDKAVLAAAAQQVASAQAAFETQAAKLGLPAHVVKPTGDPREVIVRHGQRSDLIVLGKKSIPPDFGVSHSHVLPYVLRHLPRPVLCAGGVNHSADGALIAYDGSPQAAKALQIYIALGLAERRSLHVLTVKKLAEEYHASEDAAAYLKLQGLTAQVHNVHSQEYASAVILAEAERLQCGLIVMGCYGRPLLTQFFGSVTKSVLRDTTLPVLLYH